VFSAAPLSRAIANALDISLSLSLFFVHFSSLSNHLRVLFSLSLSRAHAHSFLRATTLVSPQPFLLVILFSSLSAPILFFPLDIFVRTIVLSSRLIHFLLIVAPATMYFSRARFISLSGGSPSAREAFRHSKLREISHLLGFRFENRRRSYRRRYSRRYSKSIRDPILDSVASTEKRYRADRHQIEIEIVRDPKQPDQTANPIY